VACATIAGSFAYTKRMADYQIWRLPKSAGFNTWLLKEMAESKNWPDPKNDNRSRMADSQIWLAQKMAGSQKGLASKCGCKKGSKKIMSGSLKTRQAPKYNCLKTPKITAKSDSQRTPMMNFNQKIIFLNIYIPRSNLLNLL